MRDETHTNFYKTLGSRIREVRGTMTQEQLARASNLSRTSVVNIESGRQQLLVHNLFQIAKALAMNPSDLIHPLEPKPAAFPEFSADEPAADWVKRILTKATELPPNDPKKTNL